MQTIGYIIIPELYGMYNQKAVILKNSNSFRKSK